MLLISSVIKKIEKSKGFILKKTKEVSEKFSISFITLQKGRDPSEKNKVIEINEGFSAIYVVEKGEINVNIYEKNMVKKIRLKEKQYIYIQPHLKYDIEGNGEIITIHLPAYNENMFSHPNKP